MVACFAAGTPIVVDLEGNSRLIEELEVDDAVLARNEFDPSGPLELKRIEEKFVPTAAVMELVIRGRSIKTTAEHPFYVPTQGKFIAAGELKAGDELVGHLGELVRVDSVSPLCELNTVYNFSAADHHTYFVGGVLWQFDLWVHNANYAFRNLSSQGNDIFSNLPSRRNFERLRGANLDPPNNFPVIDRINRSTGLGTSMKTIDLGAAYTKDTKAFRKTLRSYIEELRQFDGPTHRWSTALNEYVKAPALR